MAEKVLKTKIALLYKTSAEWKAIENEYKPLEGEVCFCEVPGTSEENYAIMFNKLYECLIYYKGAEDEFD